MSGFGKTIHSHQLKFQSDIRRKKRPSSGLVRSKMDGAISSLHDLYQRIEKNSDYRLWNMAAMKGGSTNTSLDITDENMH